jgi:hypothetical protein
MAFRHWLSIACRLTPFASNILTAGEISQLWLLNLSGLQQAARRRVRPAVSRASTSKAGRARKGDTMSLDCQTLCKMELFSLKHRNEFAPLANRTSIIGSIFVRDAGMLNLFRAARWMG